MLNGPSSLGWEGLWVIEACYHTPGPCAVQIASANERTVALDNGQFDHFASNTSATRAGFMSAHKGVASG